VDRLFPKAHVEKGVGEDQIEALVLRPPVSAVAGVDALQLQVHLCERAQDTVGMSAGDVRLSQTVRSVRQA
jgi:hypothetical protein